MLRFFEGLWQLLSQLINWVVTITRSLFFLIDYLGDMFSFLWSLPNFVPSIIFTSALVVVVFGIIKFLIGRSNS